MQNTPQKTSNLANRSVREVYPVSRLIREVRVLLENSFPLIWVEGEISNLAMPASGHIYFTLKDEVAQVRCAMFRNKNQHLTFTPENGMQVMLRVRVTMYEARGEFQLIAEHMEEAGSGALQRAYEALKHRLGQEGLFEQERKKQLPSLPSTIGIVSSPDGAAVHDILSVLKRRFPIANIILYPVPVQGEGAAEKITQAILTAEQRAECDVLIVGRGGGSLEDLWAFNDEALARVIAASALPIVSAVGHEVDFTICDFVADVRAPTPSAAAEIIVPELSEMLNKLSQFQPRLTKLLSQRYQSERKHLQYIQSRLPKPQQTIQFHRSRVEQHSKRLNFIWQRLFQYQSQRIDYLSTQFKHPQSKIELQQKTLLGLTRRFEQALSRRQNNKGIIVDNLSKRLTRQRPEQRLSTARLSLNNSSQRLHKSFSSHLSHLRAKLSEQARTLSAVSPLNTLERGYSIARNIETQSVITDSSQTVLGQEIEVKFAKGRIQCEVKNIDET